MDRWRATVERIGARFEERDRAVETMLELRRRFDLDVADVEVRPLGTTHYDEPPPGTLLAGQFPANDVEAAVGLITASGGEIVERRPEPDPAASLGAIATAAMPEPSRRIEPRDVGRPTRSRRRSPSP
ncbi:MAG TPA: hypothetical protein VGJ17_07925 [Candidatus Limnocylindrales bacterium]|jgi:hypothetical protein